MLRAAGAAVDDSDARRLDRRARPAHRPRLGDRTGPVRRGAVPGRGPGHRRRGDRAGLAAQQHASRSSSSGRCCSGWAARSTRSTSRADRPGHRRGARPRRRPVRRQRADPGADRAGHAGRLAVGFTGVGAHPRPRDRPARRARRGVRPGSGARRDRDPGRAGDPAPAAARRRSSTPTHDHRMAHAAAVVGLAVPGVEAGRRGVHLARPCRSSRRYGRRW